MTAESKSVYDLPTGVTFFLVGLGMGAILALVFSPRMDAVPLPARRAVESREFSPAL